MILRCSRLTPRPRQMLSILSVACDLKLREPGVVDRILNNDETVCGAKNPIGFKKLHNLLKAMQRVTVEVGKISLPFIVMQGSEDKLVDPGGTRMLYEEAGSKDKTLKIYEGFFHEVCNEPECALVLGDIGDWLDAHA